MEEPSAPFAHLLQAANPSFDVLKFRVPISEVNVNAFRTNQMMFMEGWIMGQIAAHAQSRPYTRESLNQSFPDNVPIFELHGFIDPDRVDHDYFGSVMGWVSPVSNTKEATVWLAFQQDRKIDLLPEEKFDFDPIKLSSTDPVVFLREFSRHPNHHVLMGAVMSLVILKGAGLQPDWFRALVYRIRVTKKGALQRVLHRSTNYQSVETVMFEMGMALINE